MELMAAMPAAAPAPLETQWAMSRTPAGKSTTPNPQCKDKAILTIGLAVIAANANPDDMAAKERKARGYTRFQTMKTVLFLIAGKLNFSAINPHAA
jgi:hypothetical protein